MSFAWRADIDALQFEVGEREFCFIHRLAFRALTGLRDPTPEDCLFYFQENRAAFEAAVNRKIARAGDQRTGNFHLTSRDVQGTT